MQSSRSSSESFFWPTVWAVALHLLIIAMLFISFSNAPELPPSRPLIQATLYQLKSQSEATVQTNQKIAGEKPKTSAPLHEAEQLEQKKAAEDRAAAQAQAAAKQAAEREAAAVAAKAKTEAEAKAKEEAAKKADAAKAEAEKKAAEQKRLADIAKKKAEDEAKKKAEEDAKKKAADEAKKKAEADAKKKAEEEAKKKAAEEAAKKKAAEDAKKKAAADAAKKAADDARKKAADEAAKRKAAEDKKAQALAELLSEDVGRQQALADERGSQVAGSLDDLIIRLVSEQWRRPPSARNGMSVQIRMSMLPDGTITDATVTRSSGDSAFDNSAVAAIKSVGRIAEMRSLDRSTFDRMYRQRTMIFKPEDLSL